MSKKWTTRYGLAAVITAILIIAVAIFANPGTIPNTVSAKSNFTVMLTDPPTVPAGTTVLNITYTDVSLHLTYANGTSKWLSLGASGTVNSFALINMSKTIATATIPTNTTIDKVEFTVSKASAVINGQTYNVTTLSNDLVMSVVNSKINQTLSGVLIDFNPTLVQIQATDANGNLVNYYVLVPSATAVVVNQVDRAQVKVGTIVKIGQDDRIRIKHVVQNFAENLTITSATLSAKGNQTGLSVTLQNNGDVTLRIFGLMLQGKFNSTRNSDFQLPNGDFRFEGPMANNIPFAINGTQLVPLLGDNFEMRPMMPQILHGPFTGMGRMGQENQPGPQQFGQNAQDNDDLASPAAFTYLALQPGQSVTLSFSGVIQLQRGAFDQSPSTVITPIASNSYSIRLSGEGFQTFDVTATA